jgi:hypothetical protein
MSLEILRTEAKALSAVRQQLRLGSCSPAETRFELLRATVWSLAVPYRKAHVNRVVGTALPTWRLLSERDTTNDETLRAELRGALSALEDAGDLVAVTGGYWAPATLRLVALPDGVGSLLVGGAPSALLQLDVEAIQFHGPHRHVAHLPAGLASVVPLETFDSWTRQPEKFSLQEWAGEVFEAFERSPYAPSSSDVFEFYLPAACKAGTPQFFRWAESADNVTATLLARRRRLYGAREYRLVDMKAGRIVGACELHDVDVRRLMYALDVAAKNPVRARPTRVEGRIEWLFTSELPRAEQRAFAAFGQLTIRDERSFERRWTFMRNEELALDMLRSLGIALGQ